MLKLTIVYFILLCFQTAQYVQLSTIQFVLLYCYTSRLPCTVSSAIFNVAFHNVLLADCPGCSVQYSCSGSKFCTSQCGFILSPGFPVSYPANQRCVWQITVQQGYYVTLTVMYFDIFEETSDQCDKDILTIEDTDKLGNAVADIGSFCNTKPPPEKMETSWHHAQVTFISEESGTATGFKLRYDQTLQLPEDLHWSNNNAGTFSHLLY